jgi:hypothetical protein
VVTVQNALPSGTYQFTVVVSYSGASSPPSFPLYLTVIGPTPPLSLVTVEASQVETIKVGKAKKETVVVLQFNAPLDAAAANNAAAYEFAPVIKVKATRKGRSRKPATTRLGSPFTPASAIYDASSLQVTLTFRGKLTASKPEELIVDGALVTDAWDREIDGNDDGQPGGDYIATIIGTQVNSGGLPLARVQLRSATLADAVDRLLARGEL